TGTISGNAAVDVSLGNFVSFSGHVKFERSTRTFRLSDSSELTDVPYTTIGLAGGTAFTGASGVGFRATPEKLGAAIVVDIAGGRAWQAVSAVGAGELVGADEISLRSDA